MGQGEVLNFLKSHPDKWYTSREISVGLERSRSVGSVSVCLKKLRENNDLMDIFISFH